MECFFKNRIGSATISLTRQRGLRLA
jgi:hypothetical protein